MSNIGCIPKSTLQLIVVSILVVLILGTAALSYYWYWFVFKEFESTNVIVVITDLSFLFIGAICPILNYMLQKSFPTMLSDPSLKGNIF